jgi:putative hydrolase of the HAD superfamily
MNIKAITFDLDGVYFVKGKENFIANIVAFGVDEEKVREVFLESFEMNHKYKTGEWTDEVFWTWAIGEWKLSKSVSDLTTLLIDCYDIDLKVVDLVKKVRANGYKTMICTNNFPARIEGLNKRFGFLNDFDVVVLSYEAGFVKPDIGIFKELIGRSNVEPEEIFMTDDNQIALKTASDVGFKTYFYESFDGFKESLKKAKVKLD